MSRSQLAAAVTCFLLLTSLSLILAVELRGLKNPTLNIQPVKLNRYNIAANSVSVSGVSSGGFFAVQFHVAYSKSLMGAGIFAAGPYYCAQGQGAMGMATSEQCMEGLQPIDLNTLQQTVSQYQSQKLIDSTLNLQRHRIYLYSGSLDMTVRTSVVQALAAQYQSWGVPSKNIVTNFTIPSGHAWITNNYGNWCFLTMPPYINNCNMDGSFNVLNTIYGDIKPKTQANAGNLLSFAQSGNFSGTYMDSTGYLYVPSACQQGAPCRLHVVFHGCEQGASVLGTEFVSNIGMNEYAESNNIIVLYPQVRAGGQNFLGCFDWVDFDQQDPNYANKRGSQMTAVANMVTALGGKIY